METPDNAIAIVGMSCRFPGASDPDGFWANVRSGTESIRHFTDEELLEAGVEPEVLAKPNYVKANGVLDQMEWFDAGFFGLSPRDAAVMDPQTRHFLECCWHALEAGGHVPDLFDGTIGVFAGAGAGRYFWQNVVQDPELMREVGYFLLRHTGNDKDFVATRASYEFDLQGPSISVQTACSTSLVAVHYACQSLLSWECDMALAGGVTIEQPHIEGYLYQEGEILAPDGHCRSYDERANGTVFGSGAGVVLLRRLADALEDGDPIRAVIRGSAVNNDGAGKVSYLAPSVDGQIKVIAEALELAGVEPDTIGLIEGHGTATPVGDPIEVTALTRAFRTKTKETAFCGLGSVKSNIGHLDTAAGVASLMKAVLAIEHGEIPPTVHFERPNPMMELESSPFYVTPEVRPWPAALSPRRAGVTSLGVGGTNAHIVLEQAPEQTPTGNSRPWQLITLSARSATALEDASRALVDYLETHPDAPLPDVSHTLRTGRKRFAHRRSLVCRTGEEAIEALAGGSDDLTSGMSTVEGREVAFLFAGGGAQYPNMGRELYESEAVFRTEVDRCLEHLAASRGTDLRELLFCPAAQAEEAARALQRPSNALPTLFAIQLAQARLWMSWGIAPSAMIGHSMGEYTAACLAGVFSPEDGVSIVALRGELFETLDEGAMLSVSLGEDPLRALLGDGLSVAAVNAPDVSVASGPVGEIEALEAKLASEGVEYRRVRIDVAAHSSMLEPILPRFDEYLGTVDLAPPSMPVISNLTGEVAGAEMARSDYWVRHLRETVRFSQGVGKLMRKDGPILLEVGPGRTLSTVARMHAKWTPDQPTLHSLPHPTEPGDALAFQLKTLGTLWGRGVDVDWSGFRGSETRKKLSLPGYPFERAPYFVPPPARGAASEGRPTEADDTRRPDVADWFYKTAWEPAPLPTTAVGFAEDVTALVLVDAGGPSDRLADRLSAAGPRVVRVRRGDGFSAAGPESYSVRPGEKEDWSKLLEALKAGGSTPDLVVHAWSLANGSGAPEAREAEAFFGPLWLFQALESTSDGPVRFVAVTTGAVAVSGTERTDPLDALLLGPVRVAPREIPNLDARLVDVGVLPTEPRREASLLGRLVRELAGDVADPVVAIRGSERLRERFLPTPLPDGIAGAGIAAGGTYLVTGGLGGLGLVVARELAEAKPIKLVLVGRTALPPKDERDAWLRGHPPGDKTSRAIREVDRLEALGAEVSVVRADVTDAARMKEVVGTVTRELGPLKGVFHTAGTLDDGPLLARTEAQARAVMAAKIEGTRALDSALDGSDLDVFVLFSSVSAVIGAPGQIDYAAANSFLDAFALDRTERTGQRTVALAWGAWRDVGMAAELAGEASYEPDGSDGEVTESSHEYFDSRVADRSGTISFRSRFERGRHWMLDEHQLRDGPWVLPGSGYVDIIRAAMQESEAPPSFKLDGLVFLRPFRIGTNEARDLEVQVSPNGGDWKVTVRGRPADTEEPWVEHAHATVGGDSGAIDGRAPLSHLLERIGAPEPVHRPPHPVMNFGPRWSNIVAEATRGDEALLRHELPAQFSDDLEPPGLHPAILDMATAGAQHLAPGVDVSSDLMVPAGYGTLLMDAPLSGTVTSHVRLRSAEDDGTLASFDITIYDTEGRPIVTVDDFTMIKVDGHAISESDDGETPRWLRDAISPAEGRDALRRVLTHDTGAHVLVATRPIEALIREAGAQPVQARRVEARPRGPARELMPEVSSLLEEHDAVVEAVALGSPDEDPARVVAFVVYREGAQATVSELRRFVRKKLDRRLVPQNFVEMVALPRDADGDVSVTELRDPFAAVDDFVAPQTTTQEVIAAIWSELLGLDHVGIHDNFLDVGGHSLVGIRVLRRIQEETGVRLEANALTMQTLEQLAAEVDREGGA